MPTLITDFNWGKKIYDDSPDLTRQLSQAYNDTARAVNTKVSKYTTDGIQRPHIDPPMVDQFNMNFEIGDIYVRTDTNSAWIMTSRTTSTAATWSIIT